MSKRVLLGRQNLFLVGVEGIEVTVEDVGEETNKQTNKEVNRQTNKQTNKQIRKHLLLIRVEGSEVAGGRGVGEENTFVHFVHMLDQPGARESWSVWCQREYLDSIVFKISS